MNKDFFEKEKLIPLSCGAGLFIMAAVFCIAILLGLFDFGTVSPSERSLLSSFGHFLVGAYGICSLLIPVFFFVAGFFFFASNWSVQRSFCLLISVFPFFTLVFAEKLVRSTLKDDLGAIAAVKTIIFLAIAVFLVAIEYLVALVLAGNLKKKDENEKFSYSQGDFSADDLENFAKSEKKVENEDLEFEENFSAAPSPEPSSESDDTLEDEDIDIEENDDYDFEEPIDIVDIEKIEAEEKAEERKATVAENAKDVEETPVKRVIVADDSGKPISFRDFKKDEYVPKIVNEGTFVSSNDFDEPFIDDTLDTSTETALAEPALSPEQPLVSQNSPLAEQVASPETAPVSQEIPLAEPVASPEPPLVSQATPVAEPPLASQNTSYLPKSEPVSAPVSEKQKSSDILAAADQALEKSRNSESVAIFGGLDQIFARLANDAKSEVESEEGESSEPEPEPEPAVAPLAPAKIVGNLAARMDSAESESDIDDLDKMFDASITDEGEEKGEKLQDSDSENEDSPDEESEDESDDTFLIDSANSSDDTFVDDESDSPSQDGTEEGEDDEFDLVEDDESETDTVSEDEVESARQSVSQLSSRNGGATAFVADDNGSHPIDLPPERKRPAGPYKISSELLTAYDANPYWIIDDETQAAARSLEATLNEFKIKADVTGIRKGPVVTMFEMLPAPGVKLSRIVALQDNIALRLAASSVRMIAPIPGKRAVGIEVPNKNRAIVSFRECIEQDRPEWKKMGVPVILGKDIQGETQIIDLVKTPHLLIAGSTGAGKSVCVNSMILSILYKRSPDKVKMILIDPKIVELKLYNDIPHLLTPVITEPKRAMQSLQYCLCEMERRYALLDGMGVRDISTYNKKIEDKHICTEKLPYLIVVIDEFADLMATTGKQLEGVLARLAAMSRAVGIHLVLATQRPSIDVITGLIKANIPSRIAFMVASKTDSRIIIDQTGAEKLLGKGDMLYASATDPFPIRIQGTFVSDQEVENVVNAVKEWGEPEYIDDEIFVDDDDEEGGDSMDLMNPDGEDPLYDKALDIVVQAGKASASYIQRRLKIGYNRAARLVEEMEERGIVGPANGSKPREVIHIP